MPRVQTARFSRRNDPQFLPMWRTLQCRRPALSRPFPQRMDCSKKATRAPTIWPGRCKDGSSVFQGSWNVFDGGLTYGKVKQARAQLEQAKVTYDDSVRQVELEVATRSAIFGKQRRLWIAEDGCECKLEALRLSDERLAAGTGTQLDVLQAQQALTTARSNLVQAEFSYISAIASYQQATATETKYNDMFDSPLMRPSTLTTVEAARAARARHDSPLDPGKPATGKGKT